MMSACWSCRSSFQTSPQPRVPVRPRQDRGSLAAHDGGIGEDEVRGSAKCLPAPRPHSPFAVNKHSTCNGGWGPAPPPALLRRMTSRPSLLEGAVRRSERDALQARSSAGAEEEAEALDRRAARVRCGAVIPALEDPSDGK